MRFSEVLGSMVREGGHWRVLVPPDWGQGRSVFGGIQAALALHAMRDLSSGLPLRVIQVVFVAPMGDAAMRVETRLLRAGKNMVHVEARILDGDVLVLNALALFGRGRPSQIAVTPSPALFDVPPAGPPRHVSTPEAPLPAFLGHFDARWLVGGPPASGMSGHRAVMDVSLLDDGPTRDEHVLAIADATPPVGLSMLRTPAFGSSLTWQLEMLQEGPLSGLPLAGWRLDIDLVAASSGYTSQSEIVWGPAVNGAAPQAIAVSRQAMMVFE